MDRKYTYCIIGSGKQGTAAAYDLVKFGEASTVILADANLDQARSAAMKVNQLLGTTIVKPDRVDARNEADIIQVINQSDVVLSAVPYYFNLTMTEAALKCGISLCDMGGHTETVKAQHLFHERALAAGISIVPDCGMGPGLVSTLGALVIELLDKPQEVYIYDGGLPATPEPPWNYAMTFHINGLTNEMDGKAVFIRDGNICYVDTLSEREVMEFPLLGILEADVTSGGVSLSPWLYLGQLKTYENKVLRYPGHFEWLKAFKTLGLFSESPIFVDGKEIIPRQVYHSLLEPKISLPFVEDICVMRAIGKGLKEGKRAKAIVDVLDHYDGSTGFTAMQRLTGWHCSTMMHQQAQGKVPAGVIHIEKAYPASLFMHELGRRGISYTIQVEYSD